MDGDQEMEQLTPLQEAFYLLRQTQQKLAAYERAHTEPIAVVGAACRFPGQVDNLDSFWGVLRDGVDAISEVPAERWDINEFYDSDPTTPNRMNTRWGGFLESVDEFDADFFGISPREAVRVDPQQRLLLEVTWEALEDAGFPLDRIAETRTGVYVGAIGCDYGLHGLQNTHDMDIFTGTGISHAIMANRLSYFLNTRGPSIAIDTACSSSLVTVHMGCQSLRLGESDMAIAGGVNLILDPAMTLALTKAHMMAPDGRCKAFDAAANGYVRSEGCGMVVLKRLSDAMADGDRVLALLRGSAVNHDGRSNGMSAPNGPAQETVLRNALADANLDAAEISYVETHGTGTRLGDPIEIDALRSVLCDGRAREQPLRIGSVKTNIGHVESAAGIAGLMKVILMLRHGEIPPHLHLNSVNPLLNLEDSDVEIPTTLSDWQRNGGPLRAGVSAFGFGGTNAHIIVEEPPSRAIADRREFERPRHIVTLSARSTEALSEQATRYARQCGEEQSASLADIAFTANSGREHFGIRAAVVAESTEQLSQELQRLATEPDEFRGVRGEAVLDRPPQVAFLFTGQGAQYAGMGRQLYETQPSFRADIDECSRILEPYLDRSLTSLLDPQVGDLLNRTGYTQPAMFAVEYALANLWRSWGIEPTAVMGHSVGEFTAACVAGVLSLEDGLRLIAERARLMQSLPAGGQMAAVFGEAGQVAAAIKRSGQQVAIAAFNGPENVVVSGEEAGVITVLAELQQAGIKSKPLATSHAFHSHLMEPVLRELDQVAESIEYSRPQLDVVSNLTGQAADETTFADPTYWSRHARNPVRFAEGLQTVADLGCKVFLEIGPNPILIGMGQRCLRETELTWLPSLRSGRDDWQVMSDSLSKLFVGGARVDWRAFDKEYARQKTQLPSYPFQRKRYWYTEPLKRRPSSADQKGKVVHPLLGEQLTTATQDVVFVASLSAQRPAWLAVNQLQGETVITAAGFVEMVLAATAELYGRAWDVCRLEVAAPLVLTSVPTTVQTVISTEVDGVASFRIVNVVQETPDDKPRFVTLASGQLEVPDKPAAGVPDLGAFDASLESSYLDESGQQELLGTSGWAAEPGLGELLQCRVAKNQALAELSLKSDGESIDDFQFPPGLLDAAFRQLSCVLGCQGNFLSEHTVLGCDRMQIHDRTHQPMQSLVTLRTCSDGAAVGDAQFVDAAGRLVAEIDGLRLQSVPRDWVARQKHGLPPEWCYELAWRPQPLNDAAAEEVGDQSKQWLIFAERNGLGEALAERLDIKGDNCTVVPSDVDSDSRRSAVRQFLSAADSGRGNVVYLSGLEANDDSNGPDLEAARQLGWGGVLDVIGELGESGGIEPPRFWIVTRGAQQVGEQRAAVSMSQAPIWGLGRVIATEYPNLSCTRIDLDVNGADEAADGLAEELRWGDGEDQVAYRAGARYIARLQLLPPGDATNNGPCQAVRRSRQTQEDGHELRLRKDGTYLVTGGLGGLGLMVAEWLVDRGAGNLVLLGRSSPSKDALQRIEGIEESGANIVVRQCDVSCGQDLADLLQDVQRDLPALRGIFHLAGVLDDGVLREQTRERFDRVMAAKVRGAWYLHELTRHRPLDLFVMFSSAASMLGSPGQGNYAAANAFLDALAHQRRSENLTALSVNWGAWDEAGMAARLTNDTHRRSSVGGMEQINPTLGLRTLETLIAEDRIQAGVLPFDWPSFLQRIPIGSEPSWLADIARELRVDVATQETGPTLSDELRDVTPDERLELTTTHIRQQAARVLAIGEDDLPDPRRTWSELGFDSLTGVEFANRLGLSIGQQLNPSLLAEQTTPESLANYLLLDVFQLAPSDDASAGGVGAEEALDVGSIETATEVEEMSADEIDALVMQQLEELDK